MLGGGLRYPGGRVELKQIQDGDHNVLAQILIAPNREIGILPAIIIGLDVLEFIRDDGMPIELAMAVQDRHRLIEINT